MSAKFRPLTSARVRHKIKEVTQPEKGVTYAFNRNPRNLEMLGVAYKPVGYHLEKPGRSFWHKLELDASQRYVSANIRHYQNGIVLSASTKEWAIKKQLFKTNDTCAFVNLARVLADRCQQCGLMEMYCNIEVTPNSKVDKFLKTLEENGIKLKEAERYVPPKPWDWNYKPLIED